jgi:hypothetical protein
MILFAQTQWTHQYAVTINKATRITIGAGVLDAPMRNQKTLLDKSSPMHELITLQPWPKTCRGIVDWN